MRVFHKSWQNEKSGWSRRVRWFRGGEGESIRLNFIDELGEVNLFFDNEEEAQRWYDDFKRGTVGFYQLLEQKG